MANHHVRIVVREGKVTLEELQKALEVAVGRLGGGCNCGLTGFDVSFLRGDPVLEDLNRITNIETGFIARS